ncbi:protein GRAVITROPIC IN THE LIGHT 1-like [Impatiens glandulifera]|uniref:protein GRAVITROPIC IN THE LIGHT 1-like n=1 Tax=Impatiens glandulifera TaxID=253017 RepID=UPI001FB0544F|nr:protein GRAVITROPIC IN THE LIGHT 1-like [Impatiens glandulifera]
MDSVDRKAVTPSKSRLFRAFSKVIHARSLTGGIGHDEIRKDKSDEKPKMKPNSLRNRFLSIVENEEEEKLKEKELTEAVLAKLFASVSEIKAAYAQLQFSQSPYDVDGIQAADQIVVSELKFLSELKQAYVKKQIDLDPKKTLFLAEIQEQKSLLKTFEVTGKKLDSQLKLKESEILSLKEKLNDINRENKRMEMRLNSSGLLSIPDTLHNSGLNSTLFTTVHQQTVKSIRVFVRLMIDEMELAGWDLETAASAIEPSASINRNLNNQTCFIFESYVSRGIFDGFNHPEFSSKVRKNRRSFLERFNELKTFKTKDYLAQRPKSAFAKFCSSKFLQLIHPKMELSLFGNLQLRNQVMAGEYPETNFFTVFAQMAKRVWLLHCLAFSYEPVVSVFQVGKGCRFSDIYMECVNEEAFLSEDGSSTVAVNPRVGFSVIPGFKVGKTVIQCQVYLY